MQTGTDRIKYSICNSSFDNHFFCNVAKVLVEKFDIKPIGTVKKEMSRKYEGPNSSACTL